MAIEADVGVFKSARGKLLLLDHQLVCQKVPGSIKYCGPDQKAKQSCNPDEQRPQSVHVFLPDIMPLLW
jgi:hypothetical protein